MPVVAADAMAGAAEMALARRNVAAAHFASAAVLPPVRVVADTAAP